MIRSPTVSNLSHGPLETLESLGNLSHGLFETLEPLGNLSNGQFETLETPRKHFERPVRDAGNRRKPFEDLWRHRAGHGQ